MMVFGLSSRPVAAVQCGGDVNNGGAVSVMLSAMCSLVPLFRAAMWPMMGLSADSKLRSAACRSLRGSDGLGSSEGLCYMFVSLYACAPSHKGCMRTSTSATCTASCMYVCVRTGLCATNASLLIICM